MINSYLGFRINLYNARAVIGARAAKAHLVRTAVTQDERLE